MFGVGRRVASAIRVELVAKQPPIIQIKTLKLFSSATVYEYVYSCQLPVCHRLRQHFDKHIVRLVNKSSFLANYKIYACQFPVRYHSHLTNQQWDTYFLLHCKSIYTNTVFSFARLRSTPALPFLPEGLPQTSTRYSISSKMQNELHQVESILPSHWLQ